MIVRLLMATVKADRAGPFNALMRSQLPILRRHPGLVYVKLARRVTGDVEEVLLYEEWRDTASLYGWAGPEVSRPRLVPGAEELVSDISVVHYEALDIDPVVDEPLVRPEPRAIRVERPEEGAEERPAERRAAR
jgi:hypothetical protein